MLAVDLYKNWLAAAFGWFAGRSTGGLLTRTDNHRSPALDGRGIALQNQNTRLGVDHLFRDDFNRRNLTSQNQGA